ncbi:hypothetical protein HN51_055239 [Arachis hypogaea]
MNPRSTSRRGIHLFAIVTIRHQARHRAAAKRATHALADLAKNVVVSCRGSGERDYRMRSYSGFGSAISTSKLLP